MDGHAYFEDFEAKERWGRFYREAEQFRLSRLNKAQKDERRWRRLATSTALWNTFVARTGRITKSVDSAFSDDRSSRTEPRDPQEQCC
jgi:hypothetical protein